MGTIIVGAVIGILVGLVIYKMVKDKKAGKSSCGCNCGCCPNSALCHQNNKIKDKNKGGSL